MSVFAGNQLLAVIAHAMRSAAFSADGRWVLMVHQGNGTVPSGVRLWPLDLLSAARLRRVRDFTPEELERFQIDVTSPR
jgi:hypothetical protein